MIVVGTGPFVVSHLCKISLAHLVRLSNQRAGLFRVQILIETHHAPDTKSQRRMAVDIEHPRMPRQHIHAGPASYDTVVLARNSSKYLGLFFKQLLIGKSSEWRRVVMRIGSAKRQTAENPFPERGDPFRP